MTIVVDHLVLDLPIYRSDARSLKGVLASISVGGMLSKDRGRIAVRALDDVSFSLQEGDRLAIVGHNGAGKTTLLRTLAGVYRPSSGRVEIEGQVSNLFDIGLGLDQEATGRENIFLLGYARGFSGQAIKESIPEAIEFSGLGAYIDLPVKTYSAGMAARLAFSVATSLRPDVLLMDEWISTGDASFMEKAEQRLGERVNQARVTVLASHSMELVMKVCNRVIVLEHGRIVADGPAHRVHDLIHEAHLRSLAAGDATSFASAD